MFHSVALAGRHEFFMAASLLVVLGAAMAAQAMGLSMAIGAFVGGLLLAETEFRRQIERRSTRSAGCCSGCSSSPSGRGST
jgi:CPA2 family monovalent cation:H+ antiporter-2